MRSFELFGSITKKEAKRVIEDLEAGDALAITNLLYTQTIKNNSSSVILFLEALSKLNDVMIKMENDEIEWEIEFNDLYRNFINFYKEKCLQIINKKGE